jgi:uncharacterized membrane-anchored protein
MGRHIGSKNIKSNVRPLASNLSTEERIHFIANIIIDKIIEDQKNGGILFKKLML